MTPSSINTRQDDLPPQAPAACDRTDRPPREAATDAVPATSPGHSTPQVPTRPATSSSASPNSRAVPAARVLSPPPTAATSRRASKASICARSWTHAAAQSVMRADHMSAFTLGGSTVSTVEKITLVVRWSEAVPAGGGLLYSSTMNHERVEATLPGRCRGVPRTRLMAPELRGSWLERRQGARPCQPRWFAEVRTADLKSMGGSTSAFKQNSTSGVSCDV